MLNSDKNYITHTMGNIIIMFSLIFIISIIYFDQKRYYINYIIIILF